MTVAGGPRGLNPRSIVPIRCAPALREANRRYRTGRRAVALGRRLMIALVWRPATRVAMVRGLATPGIAVPGAAVPGAALLESALRQAVVWEPVWGRFPLLGRR